MDDNIFENMQKLKKELYKIECANWVLNKSSGKGASGNTLEMLLNKAYDNYALPDYKGIELKCRSLYSNYPFHLFCATFDDRPLRIKELLQIGGYPSKVDSNINVFNISVGTLYRKAIRRFEYKLNVNYDNQRLELIIYYRNSNIVYKIMCWSFEMLKERLYNKLKYMALVGVSRDRKFNNYYFKYSNVKFYKLRDFNSFLQLLENGNIIVTFKISYYHSGIKQGQLLDRGTSFDINYDKIDLLFEELDIPFSI